MQKFVFIFSTKLLAIIIGLICDYFFTAVQHVYKRMSNKNRRQGNPPSHQSHDDDVDHVISNEEAITNEATDPVDVVNYDVDEFDVTDDDDDVVVSNSEVNNNTEASVSNINDVTISNIGSNVNVAISNNDVTTDDIQDKREEKYCAEISSLTRTIELHRIREEELLNNLTDLEHKYKSLQERSLQQIDAICNERDQYKKERDGLQIKLDNTADVTLLSGSQQKANFSPPLTPHSNTWHQDIKVMNILWYLLRG